MLAVAIGWEEASPQLADACAIGQLAAQLNERHLASKEAQRGSVALYALLYFRNGPVVETAYATRAKPNGIEVLVPRYGVEGWVFVDSADGEMPLTWDDTSNALVAADFSIKAMDRISVRISVDESRLYPRLNMELLDSAGLPLLETLARAQREGTKSSAGLLVSDNVAS